MSSKGNPYTTKLNRGFDLVLLAIIVVTFVIFFRTSAHGQGDPVWTGGTNTTWSTPGNWSPAATPAPTDVAQFTGTFSNQPNLTAAASAGGLWMTGTLGQNVTISSPSFALTLNGTTINSIGGLGILVDNTDGHTLTISAPLTLGAAQDWRNSSTNLLTVSGAVNTNAKALSIDGTGNTTINGTIGGSGTVTLAGSGVVTFSNTSSTYSGQLTVQSGTLSIDTANASSANGELGNSSASVILGGSGTTGTLEYTGGTAGTSKKFTMATGGTGAFQIDTAATALTISGVIDGSGGLLKTGSGTLTLSGTNTFTGGVTINAGTLRAGGAGALNSTTPDSLSFGASSTGKFQLNGNDITVSDLNTNATVGSPVIESGSSTSGSDTLTVNTSNTDSYAGVLQNGSTRLLTLTKSGTGTLNLSGANTYTGATAVNAGTLTLSGSLGNTAVTVGAATLNLNNASAISQNVLTVNNASSVVTENTTNALGGTAALTQSNGMVTLSSANNFSGATAVSGGTLQLQNAGSIGSSALTLSGGILDLRNDTNNTTFSDASTNITGSATINVDHASSGSGNTLLLGNLGIGSNTLTVTNGDNYNLTLGNITLNGNPTFNPSSGVLLTMGALTSASTARTITFNGAGNSSVTGVINDASGSGNTSVQQTGTGTTTLSGNNTYSGGTTISSGTLMATTNATALGTGTVTLSGTPSVSGTLDLANDTGLNFGRNVTLSSASTNQVTFTIDSDVLTPGGTGVTHTLGSLTISKSGGSTLQINPGGNVGSGTAGIVLGNVTSSDSSPTFSVATGAQLAIGAISFTTTGNRAIQFTGNGNTIVNGIIHDGTGAGNGSSLTKTGNGTLFLTQANQYTGVNGAAPSTTIDGGIINASVWANGGSNSSIGAGGNGAAQLVIGGGTLQYTGSTAASTDRLFTIGDNGVETAALDASGTGSGTLSFTNGGSIAFDTNNTAHTLTLTGTNTGANTFTPLIGNSGSGGTSLTKTGTGTWVLNGSGSNTFTGSTTVSGGELDLSKTGGATAISSTTVTVNGGTLKWLAGTTNEMTTAARITMTSGAINLNGATQTVMDLTNSGGTFQTNGGSWTGTSNSMTWSGTSTNNINGGSVTDIHLSVTGGTNTISGGGVLNVNPTGTGLEMTGASITDNGTINLHSSMAAHASGTSTISGSGSVDITGISPTITVDSGATLNISAAITGTGGAPTKAGAGTMIMGGTNTYSGNTTVNAGSLFVNGSNNGAGSINVNNSGTTLGGSGSIAGSVSIGASARLAPGPSGDGSTGILHTGALTLTNSTSVFSVDLNSPTAGSGYDQVVASSIALNNATLSITAGSLSVGQQFVIGINSGSGSDGTFSGLAEGGTVTSGMDAFTISYMFNSGDGTANDILLTVTQVPEPGTWASGILTAVVLASAARARRRTRHASK